MLRRPVAFALVALLAGQPGFVLSGPGLGTLKGVVTIEGRPVNGVGVAEVAELLGHTGTDMVMRHYQHLSQRLEHLRNAAVKATRPNAS